MKIPLIISIVSFEEKVQTVPSKLLRYPFVYVIHNQLGGPPRISAWRRIPRLLDRKMRYKLHARTCSVKHREEVVKPVRKIFYDEISLFSQSQV